MSDATILISTDGIELVCSRTVASRLRSLCLPATVEAHRRAIGTKFPLPITIKAPRAGPGVGGGNFVPIARRCASPVAGRHRDRRRDSTRAHKVKVIAVPISLNWF